VIIKRLIERGRGTDPMMPGNPFVSQANEGANFSRMISFWKISEGENLSLSERFFC
jgi:hypothetical protein